MTKEEFTKAFGLDGEVWESIPNYEDLYVVSNYGRVGSLGKTIEQKDSNKVLSYKRTFRAKILRPQKTGRNKSYLHIGLHGHDGSYKKFFLHRLVATAFVPNPHNLPFVNHKDAQPLINNRADNLEWCTQLYNVNYGDCRKKMSLRASLLRGKGVYHIENGTVQRYDSLREASEKTGIKKDTLKHYCYHNKKGWNYSK